MLAETVASWKDTWLAEGIATGRLGTLMENIRALMETLNITKEKAMDMLKVSEEDRAKISSKL